MAYYDGLLIPAPRDRKDEYRRFAGELGGLFRELGASRHVECWGDDLPDGKVTDFRKAVQAKEDEDVLFSWLEYESKEARQAAHEKMQNDPRMQQMGQSMPFDGSRMIIGGFETIVEKGEGGGDYVDGFIVPVPDGNREAYREMASKAAPLFEEYGAVRVIEAWGEDVAHGQTTDFYRAVKSEGGESIVFSFIEWPDKATRVSAWEKLMKDERMKPPEGEMPFNGQRMFWGGFEKIVDSSRSS